MHYMACLIKSDEDEGLYNRFLYAANDIETIEAKSAELEVVYGKRFTLEREDAIRELRII